MPKRRACRGPDAEGPGVVPISPCPTPRRIPPLASRSVNGGELQAETRTSDTEDEPQRAVDASAARAARVPHRRLPPNRPDAPRLAIRSDAVVGAGRDRGARGTGRLHLLLRENRGA
jgi:hypothetical protein